MKEFTILVGRSAGGKDAILRMLVNNYDEVEYELRLKEKNHADNISKLREYKNQF